MEKLNQSGNIIETKEMPVSGILTGISKGYLATWDVDRGNDQYQKGCFLADIEKKKARGKNIPLKNGHGKTIGKIPIDLVFEDNIGLFIEGQINLEVQEGRETFSLIKQQAIQEFSIGYIAEQKEFANGVRKIYKSIILEGSVEPIPMNEDAIITEVKSRDTLPTKFAEKTYLFNHLILQKLYQ